MKKYFFFLCFCAHSLYSYPSCSVGLADALHTIYHFPEGRSLIESVEQEGGISIIYAPFKSKSQAMWVSDDRTIVINANTPRSFGEVIRSIFFELHNALANQKFEHIDWLATNQRISREEYVEAVERIEYQNATQASSLINRAIQLGYFPADARWPIPLDFDTHFFIQKQSGHSANIASLYDTLNHNHFYGCCH